MKLTETYNEAFYEEQMQESYISAKELLGYLNAIRVAIHKMIHDSTRNAIIFNLPRGLGGKKQVVFGLKSRVSKTPIHAH